MCARDVLCGMCVVYTAVCDCDTCVMGRARGGVVLLLLVCMADFIRFLDIFAIDYDLYFQLLS